MTGTRKRRAYYLRRWLATGGPNSRKQWAIANRWRAVYPPAGMNYDDYDLFPMFVYRKRKGPA